MLSEENYKKYILKHSIHANYNQPIATVVIVTYNVSPDILKRNILQLSKQTFQNFETVLVNNSTNNRTPNSLGKMA